MKFNMDEKIRNELSMFISNMKNIDNEEKKLYHYNSVINLSNTIVKYNDAASISSKKLLIEYFEKIHQLNNYLIDEGQSIELFKEFLLPVGHVLIKKAGFKTKADIFIYIILGIFLDIIVFGLILNRFYVVFTFILLFLGYLSRKKKINTNKFFSMHW